MKDFLIPALAALSLASAPLVAGTYTYEQFEISVNHIDLEDCPEGLGEGDVFCRVSMFSDALHVYVFSNDGDRPFVAMHSFHEDEFMLILGN